MVSQIDTFIGIRKSLKKFYLVGKMNFQKIVYSSVSLHLLFLIGLANYVVTVLKILPYIFKVFSEKP